MAKLQHNSAAEVIYPESLETVLTQQPLLSSVHLEALSSWIFSQTKELFPDQPWVGERTWLRFFAFLAEAPVKSHKVLEVVAWACIWLVARELGMPFELAGLPITENPSIIQHTAQYVVAKTHDKATLLTPIEKCAFLLSQIGYGDEEMSGLSVILEKYFAQFLVLGESLDVVATAAVFEYIKQRRSSFGGPDVLAELEEVSKDCLSKALELVNYPIQTRSIII